MGPRVILASASRTRLELLRRAGVPAAAIAAGIDEAAVKSRLAAAGAGAARCAEALAEAKAAALSPAYPDALVIGADQILELDGAWLDKPEDVAAARIQLRRLSGRRHALVSAAVVLQDGVAAWRGVERASLSMRRLGETFLEEYLEREAAALTTTVGSYRLEGLGVQLFDAVEGDYFAILGLPLLPLLGFLRSRGVLAS